MESGLVLFAAEKFGWFLVKLEIFLCEKLFVLNLKICLFMPITNLCKPSTFQFEVRCPLCSGVR